MNVCTEKLAKEPARSAPDNERRKLWANATPALILMCVVLLPSGLLPMFKQQTFLRYKGEVIAALQSGDYDTANLFADKMRQLAPPGDSEALYHWATIETLRGNRQSAMSILQELAPEDSRGFGAAHLWLARDLLQSGQELIAQNSGSIIHHLNAALEADPDQAEARFLLGRYQRRTGDHRGATESLQKIVKHYPSVHFLLADSYEQLHDTANAGLQWEAAAHHFRQATDTQPDVVDHWWKLCQCYFRQQRFEEAEQTIKDGILHFRKRSERSSGVFLSQAFSTICAAKLELTNSTGPRISKDTVHFLTKALDYDPGNTTAISAIADLWNLSETEAGQVEQAIGTALTTDRRSAVCSVMLGILRLQQGDQEAAEQQMRTAESKDTRALVVMHNVAQHVMNSATPATESVVQLCDAAIPLAKSGSPILQQLLSTRGQLHMELQHWELAYEDFRVTLTGPGHFPDIHRRMAKVCQQLGKTEEAETHQRAVNPAGNSKSP